jgi:DNA processing protein
VIQTSFNKLVQLKQLHSIEGIGPQKILSLLGKFRSTEEILNASLNELVLVDGISKTLALKIIKSNETRLNISEELEKEIADLEKINASILTFLDEEYPSQLKNIYFPPIVLYYKGNIELIESNSVAIVGTREPTSYGRITAELIATELANRNVSSVSGLARGIDTIVHTSSLKASGKTIAIIGSGLDVIYPPENKKLFDSISESGLIISEYPLGTKPDAQNFPRRNRIISGISLGTLIVETKLNGGAMLTAQYALDQGKEVFAVPGNINSKYSEGPNILIQRGSAKLIRNVDDILVELRLMTKSSEEQDVLQKQVELNLFEEKILCAIKNEPKQIDEISLLCGLSTSDCLIHLLSMEFKGVVRQRPGKVFSID